MYTKSYLSDRKETGTKPRNFFDEFINRKGADYIKKLGIEFSYSKPVELIEYLLKITRTPKDAIILDVFAGSSTTGEAVFRVNDFDKGNRNFVLCEQLDYAESISVKRLIKVVSGFSFTYCELAKLNQNFVDKITEVKTTNELKQIWETIKKDGFISYKVEPKEIDNNISDFEQLSLQDQKKFLIEVLDKNHLYVNYSEIDDKDYKISEEDKKLKKKFYSLK
ncbi:MAG: DNA methyltransferase [Bacteroidota bacterium]|nr:DNA methyltransferase [Bacteroidota bacterium]